MSHLNYFNSYLNEIVLMPIVAHLRSQGSHCTLEELLSVISQYQLSPPAAPAGPVCQKVIKRTGKVCGKPLVENHDVCKRHMPTPENAVLCQTVSKEGKSCPHPAMKDTNGTVLTMCRYHKPKTRKVPKVIDIPLPAPTSS